MSNLADLYTQMQRYVEAERFHRRALAILHSALGPDHAETALFLFSLAASYHVQKRYDEAEPLFQRSIAMTEKNLGPQHPQVARTLAGYAALLRATKRKNEATKLEQRARAIASSRGLETAAGVLTVDYGDLRDSALREPGR